MHLVAYEKRRIGVASSFWSECADVTGRGHAGQRCRLQQETKETERIGERESAEEAGRNYCDGQDGQGPGEEAGLAISLIVVGHSGQTRRSRIKTRLPLLCPTIASLLPNFQPEPNDPPTISAQPGNHATRTIS